MAAAVASLALAPAASAAELSSGFATDDEGWRVFGNSVNLSNIQSPEWIATGGNPDGYVRVTDGYDPGSWELQAPLGWRGNKAENYGGSISFDLRHAAPDHGPIVSIQSYDWGFLFYVHSSIPSGWRTYSTPLSETDPCWSFIPPSTPSGPVEPRAPTQAEFLSVLGAIDNVRINGELEFGSAGAGELDNVRLSQAASPTRVGCGPPPDSDGDLTPDESDACPTQQGIPPYLGCPAPASTPPPGFSAQCLTAQQKLAKAKAKLKESSGKARQRARAKVKKAKERATEACS